MQVGEGEENVYYSPEMLAHHLLTAESTMENLGAQVLGIDVDNTTKSQGEDATFKFETLINISMYMVFQYLHMLSLADMLDEDGSIKEDTDINPKNMTYDINKFKAEELEQLLQPRMAKLCILSSIHETTEDDKEYYCRTIFKDNCTQSQKAKHFSSGDEHFHFLLNPSFKTTNSTKLDDVYTVFKLDNKHYRLGFSIIQNPSHK